MRLRAMWRWVFMASLMLACGGGAGETSPQLPAADIDQATLEACGSGPFLNSPPAFATLREAVEASIQMIQLSQPEFDPVGTLHKIHPTRTALLDGDKLEAWFDMLQPSPDTWVVGHYYVC